MEGFIKIKKDNKVGELLVDSDFFEKEIILKASYQFLDKAYFFFKKNLDNNFLVQVTLKDDKLNLEDLISDYYDELINFFLRIMLEKENKEIRNEIFSKALSNSFDYSNFVGENDLKNIGNTNTIDFDKNIDEILKEIENDPDLKIDEDEISRILKEIENESLKDDNDSLNKDVNLDINGVKNAKKKFQNRS